MKTPALSLIVFRLACGFVLACSIGCRPNLEIQAPEKGAMLEGDTAVEIVVGGVSGSVTVEALDNDSGEVVEGDGARQARRFVPAHDGLGFVAVESDSSPQAFAVRSWHQGTFLDPNLAQANISTGRLDLLLLDAIGDLVGDSLEQLDLARYASNPVLLDAPLGDVTMEIVEARSEVIDLDVQVDSQGALRLAADLHDVTIQYQADHPTLGWLMDYGTASNPEYGVGTFSVVRIEGEINLPAVLCDPDPEVPCEAGDFLEQVQVTHGGVEMDDPNCEFLWGTIDLCGLVSDYFEDQLPPPLAVAAERSAAHVLRHLVQSIDPQLNVQFDLPIDRSFFLTNLKVEDQAVVLEYSGIVRAVESRVAREGQGVLQRSMTTPGASGICVGRPAVNALGYAAWDAGNMREIHFDKAELVEFGMPDTFPWSDIRSATLESKLPPLLEFREGAAWLDIGGIRGSVDAGSWGEAVLWAAVQVPVRLTENEQGGMTLVPDPVADGSRQIQLLGVGFEEAHDLLDRSAAVAIIEAAVPGLIEGLLGELANLVLPEIALPPLEGTESGIQTGSISLAVSEVEIVGDAWCVPATLEF